MIDLTAIQLIVTILSTVTVGGIIGFFVGLPYLKRKEKAKMEQEVEQATSLGLNNVKNLIDLYNKALQDNKNFQEDTRKGYEIKITQLEDQINSYKAQVERYSNLVKEQELTIDKLTKSQLKLKLQIQSISDLNNSDCDKCQFKDTCEKIKAKNIIDEHFDAKDIHSSE